MADHEPPQTFPERIRVHALAKLLGVTSKQVLAELEAMGTPARSVQSSVVRTDAETLASTFGGSPVAEAIAAEAPAEAPAPDAAPEAPASTEPDLFTGIETEPVAAASHSAEAAAMPLFLQPEPVEAPKARRRSRSTAKKDEPQAAPGDETETPVSTDESASDDTSATPTPDEAPDSTQSTSDESDADDSDDASGPRRRRRGRRGRGRGRGDQNDGDTRDESSDATVTDSTPDSTASDADTTSDEPVSGDTTSGDTTSGDTTSGDTASEDGESGSDDTADETTGGSSRRSGNRRSRGRRSGGAKADAETSDDTDSSMTEAPDAESATDTSTDDSGDESSGDDGDGAESGDSASRRRRRRRRRKTGTDASGDAESTDDDPPNTVVHEREPRSKARPRDEVQGISGSTRLEAKRQRRRDGRDAGRRRPPILTESEFLARREAVDRTMVVREKALPGHPDLTQVAVLEDGVLVEHFVTSTASGSIAGNVYLGRVQNVLPSMEAAFIDIGKGRNGVLYAGEVDWDAAGLGGSSRKIEQALKPGDQVLVQVSKDPVGHKGARLTTQISLAGRFLVYVPGGSSTGISRKLPDNERKRLKDILRDIVPPEAGVIIRTASEGVSAEELARDVTRLQAQWATVSERSSGAESAKGSAPVTLYEEPDLLVKVVRDLFNEDFSKLVIEGDRAWSTVQGYIETVAPDMLSRVERYEGTSKDIDVFAAYRIDEQLAKALDRKVWLPSGGTLVIDRTEAMTVVDVNTGKFTGEGGNLEETVTRNNLEAAEEVVRQMRLRDIGGMIVVDFIDMVLESNRDLVLRRLTEALGRDRTRHQVSEVTSLGLVQMTRKRMGTGLIEAFSTNCEHCHGRGLIMHQFPVEPAKDDGGRGGNQRSDNRSDNQRSEGGSRRKRGGRDRGDDTRRQDAPEADAENTTTSEESATDLAARRAHPVALAMAAHLHPDEFVSDDAANAADSDTASAAAEAAAAVAAVRDAGKAEPSTPESAVSENTEPVAEPEAAPTRARRSRRVSRAASAPAGESAGTVIVVPVADSAPSTDDNATAASDSALAESVATEAPAEPVTAGGEASVAPTAPARRPRRRAAGRPAGPPVDED